jgi:hypothetical protein
MEKTKEMVRAELVENGKAMEALPAHFRLDTGLEVTYSVDHWMRDDVRVKLHEVPQEGRRCRDCGYLEMNTAGDILNFSFSSIAGRNNGDAAEAYRYFKESGELLSSDFRERSLRITPARKRNLKADGKNTLNFAAKLTASRMPKGKQKRLSGRKRRKL